MVEDIASQNSVKLSMAMPNILGNAKYICNGSFTQKLSDHDHNVTPEASYVCIIIVFTVTFGEYQLKLAQVSAGILLFRKSSFFTEHQIITFFLFSLHRDFATTVTKEFAGSSSGCLAQDQIRHTAWPEFPINAPTVLRNRSLLYSL